MSTTPDYAKQLDAAVVAVNAAGAKIREYFAGSFGIEIKADNSPVTEADIEAEKIIRSTLLEVFPDYGFYGEETGKSESSNGMVWLVDPIDGTKSFVRRSPFFSTQIALMSPDGLVVGVSDAPCLPRERLGNIDSVSETERVIAVAAGGCRRNTKIVTTSKTENLSDAYLSSGNLKSLAGDPAAWSRYATLVSSVARVRGYGDFYHYHQLVSGQADLVIESDVNILDIAALVVAVREAGGVFTDLQGYDITLETTSVLAAATPALHAEALAVLGSAGFSA